MPAAAEIRFTGLLTAARGGGAAIAVDADVRTAFGEAGDARHYFEALAFSHRREYARWIGEAKRPETRDRRAARAVEMLRAGVRHP
jgi:uncharacterized protein YdeI (YjbR/CyaY-like superfamily)